MGVKVAVRLPEEGGGPTIANEELVNRPLVKGWREADDYGKRIY
jgi:hypothetical protein